MALEKLTVPMRDMLIEHLAGPVPVQRHAGSHRPHVMKALLQRKWLCGDRQTAPRHTLLTREGDRIITAAIADMRAAVARADAHRAQAEQNEGLRSMAG